MKIFIILCVFAFIYVNGLPSFDFEAFGITTKQATEEKIKCLLDGTQLLYDNNTDLNWWFDDTGDTMLKLIESAEKCETLTGILQARCLLKFQTAAVFEVRRLIRKLPDDRKELPKEAKDMLKGCLRANTVV